MTIDINGQKSEIKEGESVKNVVDRLNIDKHIAACALNAAILKREEWAKTALKEGDRLEFLTFVGGGAF
ncbi:MAG: sulfur carrier protein ThiS [Helicobacteraceae bacterium]|jgi:sulfur carrier protein|nr:sulfur carrier protein ThiS [Helicobacteraceae bacterium]